MKLSPAEFVAVMAQASEAGVPLVIPEFASEGAVREGALAYADELIGLGAIPESVRSDVAAVFLAGMEVGIRVALASGSDAR